MQLTPTLFLAACIMLTAVGLVYWNLASWRLAQEQERDADKLAFAGRQFRRRVQASGMLFVLGIAFACSALIVPQRQPLLFIAYWLVIALVTAWMGLLAVGDLLATHFRFKRLLHERALENARLKAESERARQPLNPGPDSSLN
jgi:hypothetical protein